MRKIKVWPEDDGKNTFLSDIKFPKTDVKTKKGFKWTENRCVDC